MKPHVRHLGLVDYAETYAAMRTRVSARGVDDRDELWFLQHHPVYTLGQSGKREHVLRHNEIPIIQSDRGGQVTYHGPGQLIVYTLFDLKRLGLGPKSMVNRLEQAIIETLAIYGIVGCRRSGAPGVYVDDAKIASLGLRIRNGYCYHGLALNVEMNMEPFSAINPCGYEGLRVTQIADFDVRPQFDDVVNMVEQQLIEQFVMEDVEIKECV